MNDIIPGTDRVRAATQNRLRKASYLARDMGVSNDTLNAFAEGKANLSPEIISKSPSTSSPTPSLIIQSTACARRTKLRRCPFFDQNFKQVDSFTDKHLPKGYAPFNVQVLDGHLFVTFALQDADKHDDVAGAGHGFVDEFDLEGHLLHRVASRGPLDSPWGLAIASSGFGEFANDLLVGNFGDGTINAFDLRNGHFEGKLLDANGAPITIGDLWALIPGNGSANSDLNKIYFTAGVENEAHGLFGSLAAVPEPDRSAMSMPGSHPHG